VSEALELRRAGLDKPILILGHTPPAAFPDSVKENIRPAICDYAEAELLSQEAQKQGVIAPFHLVVDTGMSRIGFQVTREAAQECARIAALPNLAVEGIFSHYATADMKDLTRAKEQAARFDEFCAMLAQLGVTLQYRHLDNSAGIMNFSGHYDMVRAGIVLYGMYPSDEVDPARLPLRPALSWHSRVTHVKTLPAGREISYGGTCTLDRETVVATIPVGYADGYRRSLSSRFHVLIGGKPAPILGRVCMDQIMVDVTDIPGVQPGDDVVLMGEGISAEEIAKAADSFNYEQVCAISRRVPRQYIVDGKPAFAVDYLN
jgi:alanine racemase